MMKKIKFTIKDSIQVFIGESDVYSNEEEPGWLRFEGDRLHIQEGKNDYFFGPEVTEVRVLRNMYDE